MHFLRKDEIRESFTRDLVPNKEGIWACITGKLIDRTTLKVQGEIGLLRPDVKLTRLPDRISVVGTDGKKIKPSKGRIFYVSTETFDPCHAITEIPDPDHVPRVRSRR